jgi:hypothetical protein
MLYFREKAFLLIFLFAAGISGCKNDAAEEQPDYTVYFNKLNQQQVSEILTGTWKVFSESKEGGEYKEIDDWYVQYNSFSEVIECRDSVYTMKTVKTEKNDVGYEWVTESDTQTRTVWMVYWNLDTLCFTSPEYPPRFSWKAIKTEQQDFEIARQNTLFSHYLSDVKCSPEAASSAMYEYRIVGKWKLSKDIREKTDYTCDNIIYDFREWNADDGTILVVTSDRPEYPSGIHRYGFLYDSLASYNYPPPLTIDDVPVYYDVLGKIMFIGDKDSQQNESIIFVRIK